MRLPLWHVKNHLGQFGRHWSSDRPAVAAAGDRPVALRTYRANDDAEEKPMSPHSCFSGAGVGESAQTAIRRRTSPFRSAKKVIPALDNALATVCRCTPSFSANADRLIRGSRRIMASACTANSVARYAIAMDCITAWRSVQPNARKRLLPRGFGGAETRTVAGRAGARLERAGARFWDWIQSRGSRSSVRRAISAPSRTSSSRQVQGRMPRLSPTLSGW